MSLSNSTKLMIKYKSGSAAKSFGDKLSELESSGSLKDQEILSVTEQKLINMYTVEISSSSGDKAFLKPHPGQDRVFKGDQLAQLKDQLPKPIQDSLDDIEYIELDSEVHTQPYHD